MKRGRFGIPLEGAAGLPLRRRITYAHCRFRKRRDIATAESRNLHTGLRVCPRHAHR
jgi:hypothetical protein